MSASSSRVAAQLLEDRHEPDEEVALHHADRQLVDQPLRVPGRPADPAVPAQRAAPVASAARRPASVPSLTARSRSWIRPGRRRTGVDHAGPTSARRRRRRTARPVTARHRRARRLGHRTTTRCGPDRNSECGVEPDARPGRRRSAARCAGRTRRAAPRRPGRRPRRLSSSWAIGGRVEVGVEQPAGAVGAAGQRVDVAGQLVDRPLPDQRGRSAGRRVHQRGDRDALVVGRAHLDRGADDAVRVEVVGDPAHQRSGEREVVELCGRGSVRTGGTTSSRTGPPAGRRRQAPGPGHLDRRLERQPLEIAGGDGPLAGAQGQRAADLGLLRRSRRRPRPAAARRLTHAGDVRDRRLRSTVSVRAPTLPAAPPPYR